jgi:hypothetical protein
MGLRAIRVCSRKWTLQKAVRATAVSALGKVKFFFQIFLHRGNSGSQTLLEETRRTVAEEYGGERKEIGAMIECGGGPSSPNKWPGSRLFQHRIRTT